MSGRLKAARANLLTGKTAHPAQALPTFFLQRWAAETTAIIGFQPNCPPCPPFFLIQWEKKDKGYKKEKRINPPAICSILPGQGGQFLVDPHQCLLTAAHVAWFTTGQFSRNPHR